jgi:serine hydrolase
VKRIIIVHGWSGSPDTNWLPWLKSELEKRKFEVIVPLMPDTDNPVIKKWVNKLSEAVGTPDSNTYLIGGSIGCQTILRYLETIDSPIGGAVFVAGWFNLENIEDENEKEIARPWIETLIDIEKVKSVLPKSTLIISDNDPYGAFEENKKKFAEFVTREVVMHNADHITDLGYPEILSQVLSLLG